MNLKEIGKLFTSKFVRTGPSSYKTRIYRAEVSKRLRNTGLEFYKYRVSQNTKGRFFGNTRTEKQGSPFKTGLTAFPFKLWLIRSAIALFFLTHSRESLSFGCSAAHVFAQFTV